MKKFIFYIFSVLIIVVLIVFILRDRFNMNTILSTIEEKTGLKIELIGNSTWNFYPGLSYSNSNVNFVQKNSLLTVQNADIHIRKSYWPLSPFLIYISAPTINYNGMEMHNTILQAKYINSIVHIESLTGNIVEGTLKLNGNIDLEDAQPFTFQGQFENISLNTLLKQSKVATWERVNIKLSSPSFKISGKGRKNQDRTTSLTGILPITGSLFFTTTDEERFGAALLSLIVEKIPDLSPISQSVDFILSNYANVPSSLSGILTIKNGSITSKEILITNRDGMSALKGSYSYLKNTINGKIYFYQNKEIFLEASLQGAIENPQILVAGKLFADQDEQPMQDIKQLLENGLNTFIEKLLNKNE